MTSTYYRGSLTVNELVYKLIWSRFVLINDLIEADELRVLHTHTYRGTHTEIQQYLSNTQAIVTDFVITH